MVYLLKLLRPKNNMFSSLIKKNMKRNTLILIVNQFNLLFLANNSTAIEVWMIWCIFSTFLILVQNSLVMFIIKEREEKSERVKQVMNTSWQKKNISPQSSRNENKQLKNKQELLKRVDKVSFAICLLIFFLFNIFFWNIYL